MALQQYLNELRRDTLFLVYGALEDGNPFDIEVVSSPTGPRVPDNALLDAVDEWHQHRLTRVKGLGEKLFHSTFGEGGLSVLALTYIELDPSFDRQVTDKRKLGRLSLRNMQGTRLSPIGISEAESILRR